MIEFFVFGALGGLCRGFFGYIKSNEDFSIKKTLPSIFGSMVIGATIGAVVDTNFYLSLTSGYMGIDIFDNLLKTKGKTI